MGAITVFREWVGVHALRRGGRVYYHRDVVRTLTVLLMQCLIHRSTL